MSREKLIWAYCHMIQVLRLPPANDLTTYDTSNRFPEVNALPQHTTSMSPQEETPGPAGSNGRSPASELCAEAIRLFISIVKDITQSAGPCKSEAHLSCLQRSLDRFRLWDDAYGVSRGEIDYLFKGSRQLRRSITGLLISISLNLLDRESRARFQPAWVISSIDDSAQD